ncbi:pLS20_p028 family conjugation system transmembrane protein [Clostridium sporogenes]
MQELLLEKIDLLKNFLGEKRKNRRFLVLTILFSTFVLLLTINPMEVQASWFTDDKEVKSFLIKYQNDLHFTKGGLGSIIGQIFSWTIIRGAYWICKTIQGLIPEALSVFSFVESTGISQVYRSVVSTIVISLMILSLIFIGFKMITQRGALDIKTVGMNVVMSVMLILLMPTMITSGIEFAKIFYTDSTNITKSNEGGVAWKMIEDGVTDLVYINKQKAYNTLGQSGQRKNALKEKDFFVYDLGEIITPDTAKDLEDDNKDAKYLQYRLSPDGEGNLVPVKIDSNWMAIFSDSFKGGYYRYSKDTFSLVIGLIALAVAYLFSAFIIITAIIELSIKRVLGVLVFATDLESGQRSKMVLSDIMQCFLTVGFQGFNMSIFAMFMTFMGSGGGASINPFIKTIAYISAVFVLIKGSGTIMRYFGVDIGVKEGFAQMASALGMSAMMLRGGKGLVKRSGGKDHESENAVGENKPEKNFNTSIKDRANKMGRGLGYGMERGLGGLAQDGIDAITNRANRPAKSIRDTMKNTSKGFREGIDDGTVNAIKKSMNFDGKEDSKQQPESHLKNSINNPLEDRANKRGNFDPQMEYKMPQNNRDISIQQQVEENIKRRKGQGNEFDIGKTREELIHEKYQQSAKYNPESTTREQMIGKETFKSNGGGSATQREQVVNTRENIQSSSGRAATPREQLVNIKENIQPSSGNSTIQKEQVANTRENIQSSSGRAATPREQLVNIKENIQPSSGNSTIQREQVVNTRENIQPSSGRAATSREQLVNIKENIQPSSGGSTIQREQVVNTRENVQSSNESRPVHKEQIINEHINRSSTDSKGHVQNNVEEKTRKSTKFNIKGNSLFDEDSNEKNSLFDSLKF